MGILFDARGNEFLGSLDQLGGVAVVDARSTVSSLSSLNATVDLDLNGQATSIFDIQSGALTATIVFEGTVDGNNFVALPAYNVLTQQYIASIVSAGAITRTQYVVQCSGFRRIRLRISAYTSGTVAVAGRASSGVFLATGVPIPAPLAVTVTAAANSGATLTIPAAGAGLFHYITRLEIARTATAALAGTATLVITSTNLPGTMAWSVGNAMVAGGTQRDLDATFPQPLKSLVANTNTTVVMPVPGAAVLWRANVFYYVGA